MHKRVSRFLLQLGLCSSIAFLVGCATWYADRSGHSLKTVQIVAHQDANHQHSTTLDIVFIYSKSAGELFPLDPEEWFAARESIKNNPALQADLISLQVPPGNIIEEVSFPERHRSATDIVVYADYLTKEGRKRVSVSDFHKLRMVLKKDHIEYVELTD